MQNNELYEIFNMGKSIFFKVIIIFIIIVCIGAIVVVLGYKQETFVCSKKKDICYIEKTNLLNLKNKHFLTKYSDIKKFSHKRVKIRGNRVSNGYVSYYLVFIDKNDIRKKVFSDKYYDKKDVEYAIWELKKQFENNIDTIIFNRY